MLLDAPPATDADAVDPDKITLSELLIREFDPADLPRGVQEPTDRLVPTAEFTHGDDAIALAEECGYRLYEFQCEGLRDKLGCNMVIRDGRLVERWAAVESMDVLSRRNGKSVEIEILILFGLFLHGERQIMYTAHRDDTAKEIFERVVAALKRTPELWGEIVDSGPRYANGQREIRLKSGQVCFFRTRTLDTARGQGFDRLILDEAQELTLEHMAAIMPVISGNPNSQVNFAGSAGGAKSTVMASIWRSYKAEERSLCYRGWHADPDGDFEDLAVVARVNPSLGGHLEYERVAKEFKRMTRHEFGNERLGVASYPREDGAEWVIPHEAYKRSIDEESEVADGAPVHIVLEADPDLNTGTIALAGRRTDGAMHVEITKHEPDLGVQWMLDEAERLQTEHRATLWIDPKGPLGFMLGDFAERGLTVREFTPQNVVNACSWFFTGINPRRRPDEPKDAPLPTPRVRHRGPKVLEITLAAAQTRKLLGGWAWQRYITEVPQGPLMGITLAGYAVLLTERTPAPKAPPPELVARDRRDAETLPGGDLTRVQF